jgi:hypothetical protein
MLFPTFERFSWQQFSLAKFWQNFQCFIGQVKDKKEKSKNEILF